MLGFRLRKQLSTHTCGHFHAREYLTCVQVVVLRSSQSTEKNLDSLCRAPHLIRSHPALDPSSLADTRTDFVIKPSWWQPVGHFSPP